jgi:hypothetical protein
MKKLIVTFSTIFLLTFMIFLFSGCSPVNNENLISDIRYGVFDGECESYSVIFTYGLRENPYYPDGVAKTKVEFGIISVIFTEKVEENDTVYYRIKINDNLTSGTLEKSPYTDQYMADIGKICNDNDNITIEIYLNDNINSEVLSLTNKSLNWDLNYEDAFKTGLTALSEVIDDCTENKLTYEIHVKILNEQKTNFGTYFWSVTIISSDGARHNVVFGTDSTDILLKN